MQNIVQHPLFAQSPSDYLIFGCFKFHQCIHKVEKTSFLVFCVSTYIWFYFQKWKILYQYIFSARNTKNLIEFFNLNIFGSLWTKPFILFLTFRKWKIFHQSVLLPRNGKNLNNFQYFQMEKKFKYRNWKIYLSPQSGKNGVTFFISLRISLHISLHFHKVENISSLPFISMKCKKS